MIEYAATVVPLRDTGTGMECLMLHRNSKIAFGGMWVFPGGRIDAADAGPSDIESARTAAVREAAEEASLVLAPEDLVPFSHWTPPEQAPRRFVTWFFLAPVVGDVAVVVDGGEIHDHVWVQPGAMLARRDAGEVELAPPTWMSLYRLSSFDTVDAALADARDVELETFETRICSTDGILTMLWEGDAGYEAGDPLVEGARRRLVADPAGWRFMG